MKRKKPLSTIIKIHVTLLVVFTLLLNILNLYFELLTKSVRPAFIDIVPHLSTIVLILIIGLYIILKVNETSEKIYSLSITDELTGLNNLRKLESDWEFFFEHFNRYHEVFCIAFIDINNFKKYNDTFGHNAGDHLLSQFALFLKEQLRRTDKAYRHGGDEFLLIFSNTGMKGSEIVSNRINEGFNKKNFEIVSLSIGLAEIKENDSLETIIERADKQMYRMKELSHNAR